MDNDKDINGKDINVNNNGTATPPNTPETSGKHISPSPSERGLRGEAVGAPAPKFSLINLPNALTCCNLISGCIATFFALIPCPEVALTFIIIGAVFDFFDGMSARALGIASPIGKELDSLADDVTFGVAPSTIIFSQFAASYWPQLGTVGEWLPFVAYIMAGFSALRLAKFNLDTRQSMGFIGLPTPANALFWGSLVISVGPWLNSVSYGWAIVVVLMLASCYLLISEIPMFALKFKHWGWRGNGLRYGFIIVSAAVIIASSVMSALSGYGAFDGFLSSWWVVILLYVVISIAADIAARAKK